jgi:serine/threonine-protein kinase
MLRQYKVTKKLAAGPTGELYLADDPQKGQVAIKVLQLVRQYPKPVDRESAAKRILQVARAISRLEHPNLVKIYDAQAADDVVNIVMEYLPGRNLSYYIAKEQLSLEEVFGVTIKAARGLAYAHQHGVIHRDVKPANIIYNRGSGAVAITDFGLSMVTGSAKQKTKMFAGTPYYMAPEQITGNQVDARTDIYALGATLYQLLTGGVPFEASSLEELIRKIEKDSPPDILAMRPNLASVGVCLRAVMDNVLQKQPQDRYQSCDEFLDDLIPCSDVIVNTLR